MFGMSKKRVSVIGAGPAGLKAAATLASNGLEVKLFERSNLTGGHLSQWHTLFPTLEPASDLIQSLQSSLDHPNIELLSLKSIQSMHSINGKWEIISTEGERFESDAVLIATGFKLFEATRKEEYGYGMYPQVVTSADVEAIFNGQQNWPFQPEVTPLRRGLVHCVGSRDAKCGNRYCSKVCCVTAVKQAIGIKKKFPEAQVYCFYMDMRMFGVDYEELYHEAQTKYNIQFIRGRLSEASPSEGSRVQVKAEDTLMGKPIKLILNMLVLMVGMEPSFQLRKQENDFYFEQNSFGDGFMQPLDPWIGSNSYNQSGLFMAGACKGPSSLPEVIQDAKAASMEICNYLNTVL